MKSYVEVRAAVLAPLLLNLQDMTKLIQICSPNGQKKVFEMRLI
jgi:hypothetical protein